MLSFFFFQAEDSIRDVAATGVQTCALPIWMSGQAGSPDEADGPGAPRLKQLNRRSGPSDASRRKRQRAAVSKIDRFLRRSEERRVGKECRSRWSPDH